MEALGPAGLTATAGIGAAAALGEAKSAMDFAHALEITANRLHVTTDALQEYRYAARLAGDSEEGADAALEAFSATLGKAQAGLPRALSFQELGFTKEQVKGFTDTDSALQAVTDRISKLARPAQEDAVVEQLGLTGVGASVVEGGTDAMTRFKEEAKAAGVVMDSRLLKEGGGVEREIRDPVQIIDINSRARSST